MVVTPCYVSLRGRDSNLRTLALSDNDGLRRTVPFRRFIMMLLPFTLLVLSAFMVVPSNAVWASTYYVDATQGKDSYNGTASGTPWKTIAKVNGSNFSAGDSILFKKGETWRETLTVPSSGSPANVITFGTYGSGENPIISGSNLITTGWAKDSTRIWRATVTTQPNIVYFNGTRGRRVAAKANITSQFKWFWASSVLYVWSPTDTDPSAYYTAPGVEAGARNQAIRTNNQSYVTVDGITARDGNQSNGGTITVGRTSVIGIVFQNCAIERGAFQGFDLGGTSTANNVTINNCAIQNNGGWGISTSYLYSTVTISNNIITGNGWASLQNNHQYSGIQGNLGNFSIYGNTIHDNVLGTASSTNQSHGIYAAGSKAVADIHDNVIYNHPNGSGIKLIGSANVYRNTIYGNGQSGIEAGQNGSANVVYVIYYNLLYGNNTSNAGGVGIKEGSKGSGTISLTVENNTLYQNGGTSTQEFSVGDDLEVVTVKNNIFYATPTRRTIWMLTQTGTVSIDYNLHWRAGGNPSIYYGSKTYDSGGEKTWAKWQAMGHDLTGVNLDPLFVSVPASNFSLQSESPAISAGTDVGLSIDLARQHVPVGAAPDIGAYEWVLPLLAPSNLRAVPN